MGSAQGVVDRIFSLNLSFLVFTFGSLLVAIQVAGGQYTPRIIATTLLRDNVIRMVSGIFVFTMLWANRTLNLISGDHVLPTITPHISGMTHAPDPLKEFFGSLDKIESLGTQMKMALPAHGSPFNNVAERVSHIKAHHVERLEKLREIGAEFDRPATVMDIAKHLFSARAQGPMADSETYAHLEHLRLAGEFDCRERDGFLEYVRVN